MRSPSSSVQPIARSEVGLIGDDGRTGGDEIGFIGSSNLDGLTEFLTGELHVPVFYVGCVIGSHFAVQ